MVTLGNVRYLFFFLLVCVAALPAADINAPAEFWVTEDVQSVNPPAFGMNITGDRYMTNSFIRESNFEPIFLNFRFRALSGTTKSIEYNHNEAETDGFWTGGEVRVYRRMENGFVHIRTDKIVRHRSSGFTLQNKKNVVTGLRYYSHDDSGIRPPPP
jgi:hypothetical protein